jgi:hypothetical protein
LRGLTYKKTAQEIRNGKHRICQNEQAVPESTTCSPLRAGLLAIASKWSLLAIASYLYSPLRAHSLAEASWWRVTIPPGMGVLLAMASCLLAVASYDSPDLHKWHFKPKNLKPIASKNFETHMIIG